MAIREIRKTPDEVLYKKSREVTDFDERLHTLLDDMADTMYEANGVGLAAVQVGILKRVVVIDGGKMIIDGNPKEVFKNVELLRSIGLDVPQVTELSHNLIEMGFDIPSDIIDIDECAEALIGFLQ